MRQQKFGRRQREGVTDLQSEKGEYEAIVRSDWGERNREQACTSSHQHCKKNRTLIYKLMTRGVKYRRYHKDALAVGSADFFQRKYNLQREHTQ